MKKIMEIKKLKKMIIVLLIIFAVVLVIFTIVYNEPTRKNLRYIYSKDVDGDIELMPLNVFYGISAYKGGVNQRTIYKALYLLVSEIIPKYHNEISNINSIGIEKYFNENEEIIKKELGITSIADFESFIKSISGLKGDTLTLEQYVFHPDGVKKITGYLENILLIKYKDNEKFAIYVRFPNVEDESMFAISCSGNVENSFLEYEYGSEFENNSVDSENDNTLITTP